MAQWKCKNCGWANAGSWDKCAKCGVHKIPTPEELQKQKIRENFLLTTTPNIEGMEIEEYLGIVSSVVVLGTGIFSEMDASIADIIGGRSDSFQNKLTAARKTAINELINNAIKLDSNAVIGIDLEYMTVGRNMLMVSANGTAVRATPIKI